MRPTPLAACVFSVAFVACSDPGDSGTVGANLGVAGASCVRTPDCRSPLQCIDLVCRDPGVGEGDVSESDTGQDVYVVDGTNPFEGEVSPDIVTAYDANDWELIPDSGPEVVDTTTGDTVSPFDDCGELGVASAWSGTFVGAIDYNLSPNAFEVPTSGTLPVNGTLGFEITCIESKFVVKGEMTGVATVQDQGDFPFELKIIGTYDPQDQRMNARMVDGAVSIIPDLIIVYFEGDFDGSIVNDDFSGEWSGESTGTNQAFITGTASGEGLWGASAE